MTNLRSTLVKKGSFERNNELVPPDERLAMLKELDIPEHEPLIHYVNTHNVVDAKPLLEVLGTNVEYRGYAYSGAKARGLVDLIVKYLTCEDTNWRASAREMCELINYPYVEYIRYIQIYPEIWKFINMVICTNALENHMGRVHQASAHAAIHGDHRDRRLFFELAGKLRRGGGGERGGGVNIIFVNDTMERPLAIEAQKLEEEDGH